MTLFLIYMFTMFFNNLRRHKNMILSSILFFYLGCIITLSFLRLDCLDAAQTSKLYANNMDFNEIEFAVLIISAPDNLIKRDAVRTTWCNFINNINMENGELLFKWNHSWVKSYTKKSHAKCFFAVGIQNLDETKLSRLQAENAKTKDLLLLDNIKDSYKNLTTKLLSSLKWFNDNLKSLKYVIKCDDDSFVRIDLIIRDLDAYAPAMKSNSLEEFVSSKSNCQSYKGLYWGYFDGRAHVYLDGKWQETEWFLCDKYLPYALGGGYVISQSIVQYVALNAEMLSHYKSEDVSMGVWTSSLNCINRVHDTRFDTEWKSRGCKDNFLVRHKQSPSDMFEMYRMLVHTQGKKLCKTESENKKSYMYSWDVLPSKCCKPIL